MDHSESIYELRVDSILDRDLAPESYTAKQAIFIRNACDVLGQTEIDFHRITTTDIKLVVVK